MNHQEARAILILFRPGTEDDRDPQFSEALDLARRDRELGRWFEEHCAFHEAVRAKFRQIPVPEGLKEQILSERYSQTRALARRKVVGLAMAATLVLLGALAGFWLAPAGKPSFALFESRMARRVLRQYPQMDLRTNDLRQIERYLAAKGHGGYVLPDGLAKLQGTGCAVLPFHGREVSMICLNSGKTSTPKDPDLFLFVIERTALAGAPSSSTPRFTRITHDMTAAGWSAGGKAYVLAGFGDEDFLRERF